MDHENPSPDPSRTAFARDAMAQAQGSVAINGNLFNSTIVTGSGNIFQGAHPVGLRPLPTEPVPNERYAQLRDEFYEGSSTRAEHIQANLDFRRETKLTEIAKAFLSKPVVIVHAASGQGKTTLAYRYLYDYWPASACFIVDRVQDVQHALTLANAFAQYRASPTSIIVYLDVHPQDTAWPELVRQLAHHPYVHILVTIRAEDFKRANISGGEFAFAALDLTFAEAEARLIYARTSPTRFLNFAEAWDTFGGTGPLMEFVYLLTHTTTLRERLSSQVGALRREVEHSYRPDKLRTLSLVAVASAYEARLQTGKLIRALDLADPEYTLTALESEYLLRRNQAEHSVGGLHALRSQLLVGLLTRPDTQPWLPFAKQILPLLVEEDLELFLFHAFVDHPEHMDELLQAAQWLQPETWHGAAGILRSLLWAGVRAYVATNRNVIEDARALMARAWYFIVPLNFTGEEAPDVREAWANLEGIISKENLARFAEIYGRQTPGTDALIYVAHWLGQLPSLAHKPRSVADWSGVAELLYWSGRIAQPSILSFLNIDDLITPVTTLPLTTCAELSVALFTANTAQHQQWLDRTRDIIEARLAQEQGIVYLEAQDDLLKIHFISAFQTDQQAQATPGTPRSADPLHDRTMELVQLVRKLFPIYDLYGAQGYGHHFFTQGLNFASTEKNITKKYLHLAWGVRLNGIAIALVDYTYRLDTWDEYVQYLIDLRQQVVATLEHLRRGLGHYLESKRAIDIQSYFIDKNQWRACFLQVNEPPELPKVAVDPWGFGAEGRSESPQPSAMPAYERLVPKALALQTYQPYLKAQREHFSSLNSFMMQAQHVMLVNAVAPKSLAPLDPDVLSRAFDEVGIKTDLAHLSTYNLWDAKQRVAEFQLLFRLHFGQRVATAVLDDLEKAEYKLLSHLWQLWYFYAATPEHVMTKAFRDAPQMTVAAHQRLDLRIQQALQQTSGPGIVATRLNTALGWDDATALWITLDIIEPINLYRAYEQLVLALQSALAPLKPQDLEHFLLRESYEFTVIVPLVRGRLISDQAFPLYTLATVASEQKIEEHIASFSIKPFAEHYIAALDLKRWTSPILTAANQFAVSVASLMGLASLLAEFHNIPDASSHGKEALKTYLQGQAPALSECAQGYLDATKVLCDQFNALPPTEKAERQSLRAAVTKLLEIHNFVWPANEGEMSLTLDLLTAYAQKLTESYQEVESIRLLWITDALDNAIAVYNVIQ